MVGGIPEKVGHKKRDDSPERVGPAQHLLKARPTLPEVEGHQLQEGQPLAGSQAHSQDHHGHQCQRSRREGLPPPLAPLGKGALAPRSEGALAQRQSCQPPKGEKGRGQRDIVVHLGVASQKHHPEGQRPKHQVWNVVDGTTPSPFGAGHDALDGHKDEGKPDGCRNDHGKHVANDHEAAKHEADGRDGAAGAPNAQRASQQIGESASQKHVNGGKVAICQGNGQHVKDDAQRIHGRVLPCSQKGHPSQDIWIPEGNLFGT
ncbi:hypothetical protein ES703_122299 [subsurface metagenome]